MKHFLITIIAIVSLISCGGAEERKEVYLEKAKQSLAAGDLDKARVELKNVLQIDPKDAQAYFQLGEIFDQKKEYQKAFNNYSKAAELDPENSDYHARIGTYLLVLAGDIDAAIEKRDLILGKDPDNISGLLLKAGILFKQNDIFGAIKISQDIFSRQPGQAQNALFLSSLYLRDEKYNDAIEVLNSSIKENSDERMLINALANAYFRAEKYDLAENVYRKILENEPDVFANYLKLAVFYRETGSLDKAEIVLRKAIEEDAEDASRKIALVEFTQQTRGNQSAIEGLKNLIVDNKDMGELRLMLAKIYLTENNQIDAENILKAAVADFSEDSVGIKSRVYLANLYMQKENVDAATDVIDEAHKISPNDSEINFIKAKLHLFNKNYDEAITSLRIVVKDDPENIQAYFLLSAAHKTKGENEQADEIIERAYENNRTNAEALLALAKYYAKNKNNVKLEKIVDNYLAIDTNNYEMLSYKSALLNERKMFSEASQYARQMIELYPTLPSGYVHSVPLMLAENRKMDAVNMLEDGYKKVDDNNLILKPLVELYATIKNFDAAENKIRSAISDNADPSELYILLAKVQVASGKIKEARKSLINAGVEGELRISMELAMLFEGFGDYNAAINEYEKAYEKNTDNVVLINNLAVLLSEHRTDEASMKRAKHLADKLSKIDNAVTLDTVGWVYYKAGDYAEAVDVLKNVVEKSPEVAVFNYHLGMAFYKAGDVVAAKTYLNSALASNSSFRGRADAEALLNKIQ